MNKVPLHHVGRGREVAIERIDRAIHRACVVAQRMNRVLGNGAYASRNGSDDDSAHADEACRLGIADHIADHIAGGGEVRGAVPRDAKCDAN